MMKQIYSISILKSILYDEQTFVQFISEQGLFSNINSKLYIQDLNNYMSLILLFDTTNINKIVFDRINSINIKYNYNQYYSYSTHITNQKNTLSASFIEQILNDDNLLSMFLDFNNHPYIFFNMPIEICLSQITSYLKKALEKNLPLSKKAYQHFQKITEKYSLNFKNSSELKGTLPKGKVNQELEKTILTNIDFSKSKLSIALQIYIELCKKLVYDATFLAFNQDIKNPIVKNIYEKDIETVNLQQNLVTCDQFSNIYANLLIKCGFEAKVKGDFHKLVVFKCNNHIIEADASKQLMGINGFYLCDLTRCKLNLPVAGFTYKNNKENIKDDLYKAYQELNANTPIFMLETIELLNQNANKETFDKKMEILAEKSKKTKLRTVDYIGYLVSIIKTIFTPKELNDIDLYTVYIKGQNQYHMGTLIVKDDLEDQKSKYFLFHSALGYANITEEQIKELLDKEIIRINRKDERIKKLLNNSFVDNQYKGRII